MSRMEKLLLVLLLNCILTVWTVHGVICLFYKLQTDCNYPVDGVSMSRIQATINECNDPPDITFLITSESPQISWSRTFTGAIDSKEIVGYYLKIYLQVRQGYSSATKQYSIQTTILSDKLKSVEIMNSVITLHGDGCPLLNEKATIAVAILGTLIGLALIALIVVLIVRRRRRRVPDVSTAGLVENAELTDTCSLPVNTADLNRPSDVHPQCNQNSHEFQHMVTYSGLKRDDHQRF